MSSSAAHTSLSSPHVSGLQPRASVFFLYHELTRQKADYAYAFTVEEFSSHLELFRSIRSDANAFWPEITFDDGHISNLDLAVPLLTSVGITAHFFITVGWTGNRQHYMSWQQLAELHRAGHQIGAHGWSHTLLTKCSDTELDRELSSSRLLLEEKLGVPVDTMSLPGGRFNRRVLTACERAGYNHIFTSIPRAETSPSALLLGRVNLRNHASVPWIESLLHPDSNLLRTLARQHRMKETLQRALGDRLYAKLWALLNRPQDGDADDSLTA